MEFIQTEYREDLAIVTLDRGTANAMNKAMIDELAEVFRALDKDSSVRGALITGKGNFFSAGLDVLEVAAYDERESQEFWHSFASMIGTLLSFSKPLVAAINGHSPAGGAIVALTCDFRYMAEGKFRIGLNEVPVGIAVPQPIYEMYAAVVGPKNAYQFLLQGKLLLPQEALQSGFVDDVCPQEIVFDRSWSKLKELAAFEPKTFALTKKNMRASLVHKYTLHYDEYFGPTLHHWQDPDARNVLNALVASLKK